MVWVIDLDGVMWLADQPLAGSAGAVERVRAAGHEVLFVTNNSSVPVAAVEAKLAAQGVDAAGAVLTSAMAAAQLVGEGDRVVACAGEGVVEALHRRGAEVVEGNDPEGCPPDAVIVGLTTRFDYPMLSVAAEGVRRGARLIGTNGDPTYPTPAGLMPGGGSLVAAVATASGVEPTIAGKPHAPMVDLVKARAGGISVVVGDRHDTDGRFAVALGAAFALVAGSDSAGGDRRGIVPAVEGLSLAEVVDRMAAERMV